MKGLLGADTKCWGILCSLCTYWDSSSEWSLPRLCSYHERLGTIGISKRADLIRSQRFSAKVLTQFIRIQKQAILFIYDKIVFNNVSEAFDFLITHSKETSLCQQEEGLLCEKQTHKFHSNPHDLLIKLLELTGCFYIIYIWTYDSKKHIGCLFLRARDKDL